MEAAAALAPGSRNDAAAALLGVNDADEVLIDIRRKKSAEWHVLAPQDDDTPLLAALQPLGLEAGKLFAGVGRGFIVTGEQHDEIARVLDRLVHRLNEIGGQRNVVILNDDRVALASQRVGDLAREGGDRAASAQKKVGPFAQRDSTCARRSAAFSRAVAGQVKESSGPPGW